MWFSRGFIFPRFLSWGYISVTLLSTSATHALPHKHTIHSPLLHFSSPPTSFFLLSDFRLPFVFPAFFLELDSPWAQSGLIWVRSNLGVMICIPHHITSGKFGSYQRAPLSIHGRAAWRLSSTLGGVTRAHPIICPPFPASLR